MLSAARADVERELAPLVHLAWPVVAAEIGWVTMWLVDTMMVGRVGADAIGAVGLGGSLYFAVAMFALGLLLGMDFLVAHAYGAGRLAAAHRALVHGVWVALASSVVLTLAMLAALPLLGHLGVAPPVLAQTLPYIQATMWSLAPLLLFTALRQYLQGLGIVRPAMVALVSANVVNAAADWVLIFGHLGAPRLGAAGAGWATCLSRVYMLLVLVAYTVGRERRRPTGLAHVRLRPDAGELRALLRLGVPSALQRTFELGVFTTATTLAALLVPVALAAHQVALVAASCTFMVPLGISAAGAVRVGQALGRGDGAGAARAGWTALALGGAVMLAAAVAFLAGPRLIARIFTSDAAVVATAATLLVIAAVFQLFDGLQVVATGVLRGAGDTRRPMVVNLVGHWLLGLPVGAGLCFAGGLGVVGIWIGLSTGLIVVAVALVRVWRRQARALGLAAPEGLAA